MNNKWWAGAAAAGALVLGACGGATESQEEGSLLRAPPEGERLIGVIRQEQGGCMSSADGDAAGDLFSVAAKDGKTHITSLSLSRGMKWSKSFEEPYSVVRSDAFTDKLILAQPQQTANWNTALLNKRGDVQRFDASAQNPMVAVDARADGKRLELPTGDQLVELVAADGRRQTIFDGSELGMTISAASFMDDETVVIAGVATRRMFAPADEIGSDGAPWVMAARVRLDGEVLWARDLEVTLPANATPAISVGAGNETVFVAGGASQIDSDQALDVQSFAAVISAAGLSRATHLFKDADAPSMVVTSQGTGRFVVPVRAASNVRAERALRQVVINSEGHEVLNTELRAEGSEGFIFRRLLKTGDRAVLAGCFTDATTVGGTAVESAGDSAFMWLMDPKLP